LGSVIDELSSEIEALEQNGALLMVEENFPARTEALDAIELDVLERIEQMSRSIGETPELQGLRNRARVLRSSLERANQGLFNTLREHIQSGDYTGEELEHELRAYAGYGPDDSRVADIGYDSLDALISGLLMEPAPVETQIRAPEMVPYQPTPARVTLDLVAKARLSAYDVFYDLGSGLGQVVILVNLFTRVRAKGIEYEPAYCAYARRCASNLDLSGLEFINGDAREADFSEGTVFYLYTPFTGEMLQIVLRRLKDLARSKPIRLFTYGPCTIDVLNQDWLRCEDGSSLDLAGLTVFHSVNT
jgi:SAM-dependent methyltransferase